MRYPLRHRASCTVFGNVKPPNIEFLTGYETVSLCYCCLNMTYNRSQDHQKEDWLFLYSCKRLPPGQILCEIRWSEAVLTFVQGDLQWVFSLSVKKEAERDFYFNNFIFDTICYGYYGGIMVIIMVLCLIHWAAEPVEQQRANSITLFFIHNNLLESQRPL